MAKLSLSIDNRSMINGMAQVRLRINHRCTSCYIGTGVYIEPECFISGTLYDPVSRKAKYASQKRQNIVNVVVRAEECIASMTFDELRRCTATDIRRRAGLMRLSSEDDLQARSKRLYNRDFLRWYEEYADSRPSEKTQDSYNYGLKVLRLYCAERGMDTIVFEEIDYTLLSDFATWLRKKGKSDATRHMLESYVRAAYKEAQRHKLISRDEDPYLDYSIVPVPPKEIEVLTAAQMRALQTAELPNNSLRRARDLAMMSFYLCGANLLDLYEMGEIRGGEVVFVRHKVARKEQRPLHIRVEPELAELVERYKGDGQMLCFKQQFRRYEEFRHKIGHRLRDISRLLGFEVNMAKVRRTWATIAGELEIPDRVIDKSMGHVDSTVKNRYYERYDWGRTARANRRVIDTVGGGGNV